MVDLLSRNINIVGLYHIMVELDRDCCRCGLPPFTEEVRL